MKQTKVNCTFQTSPLLNYMRRPVPEYVVSLNVPLVKQGNGGGVDRISFRL